MRFFLNEIASILYLSLESIKIFMQVSLFIYKQELLFHLLRSSWYHSGKSMYNFLHIDVSYLLLDFRYNFYNFKIFIIFVSWIVCFKLHFLVYLWNAIDLSFEKWILCLASLPISLFIIFIIIFYSFISGFIHREL